MKKFIFLFIFLTIFANSAEYQIDKDHTNVGFRIKHISITNINGNFKDYDAILDFDRDTQSINYLKATIRVASINTQNTKRDNNLTSEIFFDEKKFPLINFKMTRFDRANNAVYGDLTIKNITKNIKLNYNYTGNAIDVYKNDKDSFELRGNIKRTDFDIHPTYPNTLLSDDVKIIVDVQAKMNH
ncbi:YceI family protein [Campylobacter sp. faydin G-24]|uniref:YceI family protein n=1 Tax=Campylobacter anatolicus TaxID=2829105 RepID=A0ABS5HI98_9BACT|nr:YceI family protein [Campylobacter anatolicus]MBR8463317.1 YceI family protein [Campylobacter anatolicus]